VRAKAALASWRDMVLFLGDSFGEESLNEGARNEARNENRKTRISPARRRDFSLYPI
jgi:hypothetical protein